MSDFVITSGKVTLTTAATKSLWLLNPVTNNCKITSISISMDASSLVQGVQFDLCRATTLGTPAGTTGTVVNTDDRDAVTATTTALVALTTEPTTYAVIESWGIQPVAGLMVYQLPLGQEYVLKGGGTRWGLRYTTASGVTPDCWANVHIQE